MKKILLIIALTLCIFQMVVLATEIVVGNPAIYTLDSSNAGYTRMDICSPANGTGTITSIELYATGDLDSIMVGIFYAIDATHFTTRSYAALGTAEVGLNQYDVDLEVEEGDFIGLYWNDANINYTEETCAGYMAISGNRIPADNQLLILTSDRRLSLRGIGTTEEEANAIFFGMNF